MDVSGRKASLLEKEDIKIFWLILQSWLQAKFSSKRYLQKNTQNMLERHVLQKQIKSH